MKFNYNQLIKFVKWIGITTLSPFIDAVMSLYPDEVTNYLNTWN